MADIRDLGTPGCQPPGAATGLEFVETNIGNMGVIIPLTLKVEWASITSPYVFDHVSYDIGGETRTSGPWIGTVADLTTDEAPSTWLISNVVVHFKLPNPVKITIITSPSEANRGETSPENLELYVLPGRRWSTTITATPNAGYKFVRWNGRRNSFSSTSAIATVSGVAGSSDARLEYVATFSPKTSNAEPPAPDAPYDPNGPDPTDPDEGPKYSYIVVYTNSDPDGVATTTPSGITYVGYPGTSKTVRCTTTINSPAGDGYEFVRWTGTGGTINPNTGEVTLVFPATPRMTLVTSFTANYKEQGKAKITVSAMPTNGGAVSGDGEYDIGDECTVVAIPKNSRFIKWSSDLGDICDSSFSFIVYGDMDLVAMFHVWTMLILRTNDGKIYRDCNLGRIVRDGDPEP